MKNKIITSLILVLIFISMVFFYMIYQNKQKISQSIKNNQQKEKTEIQRQATKDENAVVMASGKGIYSYNVKSKKRNIIVDFSDIGSDPIVDAGQFNSAGKLIFSISGNKNSQVFVFDENTKAQKLLNTNPINFYNKNFNWSEEGIVVYQALTNINENPYTTNGWNIYTNKEGGEERLIVKGISPSFLSKNKIIFLKQDGIYVLNTKISDDLGYLVWKTKKLFNSKDNHLSVSKDKKLLALTELDKVSIFNISNIDKVGMLENPKEIKADAISATFSEDSKSIVLKDHNQSFSVYDLTKGEKID